MTNRGQQVERNEERMAAEGIEPLKRGDVAPPFSTKVVDGSELSIPSDLADQRLMLFFYPADYTPNSTRDLQQLGKFQGQLAEAGIRVYGISGATVEKHRAFADRYGLTVPLLADPDLAIAKQYGCAPEDAEFSQRTLVGIDTDGKIAFFERGFPFIGKVQTILDWFAGQAGAAATTPTEETAAPEQGGKLGTLDEDQRRAVYIEIKQERNLAWAEAEEQYPLEPDAPEQREQVRKQSELATELEEQYLLDLAQAKELTRDELQQIEDEGDGADWPKTEPVEESPEAPDQGE